MRAKKRKLDIGPWDSVHTLEERVKAVIEHADTIVLAQHHRMTVRALKRVIDDDRIDEVWEQLHDLISNYTPALCYVGFNEHNEYGVWPDSGEIPFHRNHRTEDEVGKGSELPNANTVPQMYWLVVNDHGNCTLYQRFGNSPRWREQWSLV